MSRLHYTISYQQPNRQLIDIEYRIGQIDVQEIKLTLPNWRPGRYEMGNFAKNIRSFAVLDAQGNSLPFQKSAKNEWIINTLGKAEIRVLYDYYAAELNAGSTWLDDRQLYMNPVNCLVYATDFHHEPCSISLHVPDDYKIAWDLPAAIARNVYYAENYDRLADAPFIASPHLKHHSFDTSNHRFHLWFMGSENPPFDKLESDFRKFCDAQIDAMGPLPGPEYHFIFQILPIPWYHGVEHTYSTVCALGPELVAFEEKGYNDLLGVSSHELYHAWNVKTIRPTEMQPYDYKHENYSRLGWIYEGITTYYGDQFLIRSGAFNETQYFETLNEKLHKHFVSYGRLNQSVADASFDTWLDGYVGGIPHRKSSIYTEGSLIALILDMELRRLSNDEKSLDDFMRYLKEKQVYSKETLVEGLRSLGMTDGAKFYETYIEKPGDLEALLKEALNRVGIEINEKRMFSDGEHTWGFLVQEQASGYFCGLVAPNSPAEKAGMRTGDQLVALNGMRIGKNWKKQLCLSDSISIHAFSSERLVERKLHKNGYPSFLSREACLMKEKNSNQQGALKKWAVNL
jgi:predicted metalloprotease with PDZ domain